MYYMYYMNSFISHKPPNNKNYNKWVNTYAYNISHMFERFIDIYNSRYNIHLKKDIDTFNVFCKFMYNSSSKYIFRDDRIKIR